jgi:hypothetical protein
MYRFASNGLTIEYRNISHWSSTTSHSIDLGKLVCIGTISYYRGNPEKRRKELARQHVQKRDDNREEEEEQVRKEAQ